MMADSNKDDEAGRRYPKRIRKRVVRDNFIKTRTKTSQKAPKEDPPASSSGQQKVLKSWKPEDQEKFELCLETYGDQDVALLTSKIQQQQKPGPTTVYNFLQKHKDFVSADDELKLPRQQRLKKWLDCIKEKRVKLPQPNPTALSMLQISLLEDHPVPTDSEVNFAEAYEYLFELLSGRNFVHHTKYSTKYSGPTLKFIRLTVLSLLKETINKMEVLHEKFVQSANDEVAIADKKLDYLPDHIQQILQTNHFNPLNLNEDALTLDGASDPLAFAPGTSNTASDMVDTSLAMPEIASGISHNASGIPDTASDTGMSTNDTRILDAPSGTPHTTSQITLEANFNASVPPASL